jgi:hypothetical protein
MSPLELPFTDAGLGTPADVRAAARPVAGDG